MKLFRWTKPETEKSAQDKQTAVDPEKCAHKEWSPRYDHTTYPGAVVLLESHCLGCGTPEKGSGQ
jgi:hypothetical protein